MIYLTNDTLDQAVKLEICGVEPHRKGNDAEQPHFGLLGNGVHEVAVLSGAGRAWWRWSSAVAVCSVSWRRM